MQIRDKNKGKVKGILSVKAKDKKAIKMIVLYYYISE
jgi:hypothetical protein